jgi:hypothetical protein
MEVRLKIICSVNCFDFTKAPSEETMRTTLCHARESGHPGAQHMQAGNCCLIGDFSKDWITAFVDARFRGNDGTPA